MFVNEYLSGKVHVYMQTRFSQHTQHVQQYKSMFFPILCTHVLCSEPRAVHFSLHKHLKLQRFGQKLQEKRPQARSFDWGPLPPSVYPGRHWHHSHDKIYQAYPLCFSILQRSKTGRWEGLGTRLYNVCIDMRVCPSNINQYALFSFFRLRKKCTRTLLHYRKNVANNLFYYGKNVAKRMYLN